MVVGQSGDNKCRDPSGDCSTRTSNPSNEHAVRCCSDVEISGWYTECGIWHESDIWPEGCQILNHADATSFCESKAGRLCTKEEIENKCVREDGCNYDNYVIWTSTRAGMSFFHFRFSHYNKL